MTHQHRRLLLRLATTVLMGTRLPALQQQERALGSSLLLLNNAIDIKQTQAGRIIVQLPSDEKTDSNNTPLSPSPPNVAAAVSASEETSNEDGAASVPASVLQYQRHLREVKANQKSLRPLNRKEHLTIVYEDEDIIVTNKPSGVLCVPGLNNKPNLLNLVCEHCEIPVESKRIVHRLDMDTSGIVLYSKTDEATKRLQAAFRDRKVEKEYQALLCGHLSTESFGATEKGDIHLPLQRDHKHPPFMRVATPRSEAEAASAVQDLQTHGFKKLIKKKPKPSHTEIHVLSREYLTLSQPPSPTTIQLPLAKKSKTTGTDDQESPEVSPSCNKNEQIIPVTRVRLIPHTGRTHQLRVHCAAIGHPIVGDPVYGLYGEGAAQGGIERSPTSLALVPGATMELQKELTELRPPEDSVMCLHAAKLGLKHPRKDDTDMLWEVPPSF